MAGEVVWEESLYATPSDIGAQTNVPEVTHKELQEFLFRKYFDEELRKRAVFIWGGIGIGKSTLVKDLSLDIAKEFAIKECIDETGDEAMCREKVKCVPSAEYTTPEEHFKGRGIWHCGIVDEVSKKVEKVYFYYARWNELDDSKKLDIFIRDDLREKTFLLVDYRLALIGDPAQLTGPIVPNIKIGEKGELYERRKEEAYSIWYPPLVFLVLSKEGTKGILFFDEFNQAIRQIMFAAYQMVLDRQVGDLAFSRDVMVIAAGNRPEEVEQVYPMPAALRDRFLQFFLVGRLGDWVEWARRRGVDEMIISFIIANSYRLSDIFYKVKGAGDKPVTPRSWEFASEIFRYFKPQIVKKQEEMAKLTEELIKAKKEGASEKEIERIKQEIAEVISEYDKLLNEVKKWLAAAVGENPAREFVTFYQSLSQVVETLKEKADPAEAFKYFVDILNEREQTARPSYLISIGLGLPIDIIKTIIIDGGIKAALSDRKYLEYLPFILEYVSRGVAMKSYEDIEAIVFYLQQKALEIYRQSPDVALLINKLCLDIKAQYTH